MVKVSQPLRELVGFRSSAKHYEIVVVTLNQITFLLTSFLYMQLHLPSLLSWATALLSYTKIHYKKLQFTTIHYTLLGQTCPSCHLVGLEQGLHCPQVLLDIQCSVVQRSDVELSEVQFI